MSAAERPDLSFVIPVYNSAESIESVVHEICSVSGKIRFEIVLVNDGSTDDSEAVCRRLAAEHPDLIVFLQLARNFGEYNAVLAGLRQAAGSYVVILDDDGQHPAAEALRLYEAIRDGGYDVVYGCYTAKRHDRLRNLASWIHNRLAVVMLKTPPGLYLSSFKVMNRFMVEALNQYTLAPPYLDALIHRTTQNISQLPVTHRERLKGRSNYDWRKLLSVSAGGLLSFSILPLRAAGVLGLACSLLSGALLLFILVDKLWLHTEIPMGVPTIVCTMAFFAGIQLLILGVMGEYVGRIFLARPGSPLFVVRYVLDHRTTEGAAARPAETPSSLADLRSARMVK